MYATESYKYKNIIAMTLSLLNTSDIFLLIDQYRIPIAIPLLLKSVKVQLQPSSSSIFIQLTTNRSI